MVLVIRCPVSLRNVYRRGSRDLNFAEEKKFTEDFDGGIASGDPALSAVLDSEQNSA